MLLIDLHSRTPVYEQIKEEVIRLVNLGVYKPGDKLPSIRSLSRDLNLNVNTVKRAFSELEEDGVTYSVPGSGIYVAETAVNNQNLKKNALNDLTAAVTLAKSRGVSEEEAMGIVGEVFK